jgi:apolipoprotein N-acyltransferase
MSTAFRERWARHPAAFVFAAGLLVPLAYAPWRLSLVFFFSYAVFFTLAWRTHEQGGRLFVIGWAFAFGQLLSGLYWLGHAFLVDADQFLWLLPFAVTLLPAGLALFAGVTVWLWGATCRHFSLTANPLAGFLLLAFFWSAGEVARSHVLTGFPWNLPSMVFGSWVYSAQPVAWVGVHGLGLIALIVAALLAFPAWRARVAGLGIILAVMGLGAGRVAMLAPAASAVGAPVLLIQPNIDQKEKWDPDKQADVIKAMFAQTTRAVAKNPVARFVFWPEAALPLYLDEGTAFTERLRASVPPQTVLVTGAVRRQSNGEGTNYFNSVMVWSGSGDLMARRDKTHLVPFGEYLPLQHVLEVIGLRQLTKLRGGYTAGKDRTPITLPDGRHLLPLICYEAIFPYRAQASPRPDLLVNLTNDGWFGQSAGPHQHLALARLRAVEQGLPLVRVANTGISAVVDALGRSAAEIELSTRGAVSVPLPVPLHKTWFAVLGHWPYAIFWFGGVGMVCFGWGRNKLPLNDQ